MAGVIFFSAFVADVSGGKYIVVMNADKPGETKATVRPKGDIARPPKGRKPIVSQKTAADMV